MLAETPDDEVEFPLRHYLHIVRRRRWTIIVSTLLVAGVALALALSQTKIYEGEAKLVLRNDQAETIFNPNTGQRNDPVRAVATEIQLIKSRPVETAVRKKLGDVPPVAASGVGQTDVISVRVRDADPARAAEAANAYATAYVDFKRTKAVDSLLTAAREIQTQITAIQAQADQIDNQITAKPTGPDVTELRAQRDSLIQQVGAFRQQLDQIQVQARLDTGGAQLVTSAEVPTTPVAPRPVRSTALGLILGLLLGVGLAFLREQLDESLRSKDDVGEVAGAPPVLGIIPEVGDWREHDAPMVVSLTDPNSRLVAARSGS